MLTEFTLTVCANSEEEAREQLIDVADGIFASVGQFPWEVVEEQVYPYKQWETGTGPVGEILHYKAFAKFQRKRFQ